MPRIHIKKMKSGFNIVVTKEKFISDCMVFMFKNSSYYDSYPEFLRYFYYLNTPITKHNLVIGINFAYGWMPTIFDFRSDKFDHALEILNNAKNGTIPTVMQLEILKGLFNNSLVGTSKLLHFINPEVFAIWDSRVYHYLVGKKSNYHIGDCMAFLSYLTFCNFLTEGSEYEFYHNEICYKVGYIMTKLRTAELVMYTNEGR